VNSEKERMMVHNRVAFKRIISVFFVVSCFVLFVSSSFGCIPSDDTLKIDPTLLFSTFIGGTQARPGSVTFKPYDNIRNIKKDAAGNTYISGVTESDNFPVQNAFQDQARGQEDAFLMKLDPDGKLLWSTYVGGENDFENPDRYLEGEVINSISIKENSIMVGGYTHTSDFPNFTFSKIQPKWHFVNSFLLEFSFDGQLLHTYELPYLPDQGYVVLQDFVMVDEDTIVVSGIQYALDEIHYCLSSYSIQDGFLRRNWIHSVPNWSESAKISTCVVDFRLWSVEPPDALLLAFYNDRIYTASNTYEQGQIMKNSEDNQMIGSRSGFLSCFDLRGDLIWNTYVDANKENAYVELCDIDVNAQGIYLAGSIDTSFRETGMLAKETRSYLPNKEGSFDNTNGFVCQYSHDGKALGWCVIGGSKIDTIMGISINEKGMIVATGETNSRDFPLLHPIQSSLHEFSTSFIAVFSKQYTLVYSTYFGAIPSTTSSVNDTIISIGLCVDAKENSFVVAGCTRGEKIPVKNALLSENPRSKFGYSTKSFVCEFSF
jgi:hypothetical protein